ncbi:heme biosynthesis HemY N-terminal domain-containing protein [Thalassomonas sp. M1454]|uniref:heme biosynthesis HemY N-terminal domain-containing protein n=1 Tax=Thalassomonas sp. M1454 TaxID=2594477 RepID=UPI00118083D6|nr:heme biosynthesis HemY N-terminal domain-containing protein [Thalassomonas sp. M1454]TRX55176.1 hypothetical protein FNN08_11350 [Thalassomonas sp. M1454]
MIRTIVKFSLFLLLIAFAPLLIDEKGYILIAMGDLTYELTVVSALIFLTIATFIFIFLYWGFRLGFKFSSKTWRKMAFSSKAKAKQQFQKGLSAYLLGDYKQAEELMAKCAETAELANSAWLIAADASHKQGLSANTENYLKFISEHPKAQENFSYETLLAATRLNLADKQFTKAREILDKNHTLIGHDARLLGVDIELCLQEQRFEKAIELLKQVKKDKSVNNDEVTNWELKANIGYFSELNQKQSIEAVAKYYKGLSRKERQSEGIILAYAHCLSAYGLSDRLDDLVLPLIKKGASPTFIKALSKLNIEQPGHLVANIQKILLKQPDNTLWLSALANLSVSAKDYDKAQKAFITLLKIEQHPDDMQSYAQLLELKGEHQQANRVYQEILNQKVLNQE